MRPYSRYVLVLAVLLLSTTVLVALSGDKGLEVYFSLYLIEYLGTTLVFAYLHPRARRLLGSMSFILSGGFLGIVAIRVAQIVWGLPR